MVQKVSIEDIREQIAKYIGTLNNYMAGGETIITKKILSITISKCPECDGGGSDYAVGGFDSDFADCKACQGTGRSGPTIEQVIKMFDEGKLVELDDSQSCPDCNRDDLDAMQLMAYGLGQGDMLNAGFQKVKTSRRTND